MRELTEKCIKSITNYFTQTNGKVAIIGISGGKDSTVTAALCVQALGKNNVLGVLMPNGIQYDIQDSIKICNDLDIKYLNINICDAYNSIIDSIKSELPKTSILNSVSKQTKINLAPRLRMSVLYAVAQSIDGGRVINTSNKCESFVGWGTLWGDTVGDFSPLGNLLVSQVIEIGDDLQLPYSLVHKTPADGLTGKSDEDNLGVSYANIERFILNDVNEMTTADYSRIEDLHKKSKFKHSLINIPKF